MVVTWTYHEFMQLIEISCNHRTTHSPTSYNWSGRTIRTGHDPGRRHGDSVFL